MRVTIEFHSRLEMGCGASKAAEVDESAITIRPSPKRTFEVATSGGDEKPGEVVADSVHSQQPETNQREEVDTATATPKSDQRNLVHQPSSNLLNPTTRTHDRLLPNEMSSYLPKPIAYEIPLNLDDKPMARKPLVRRLEVSRT